VIAVSLALPAPREALDRPEDLVLLDLPDRMVSRDPVVFRVRPVRRVSSVRLDLWDRKETLVCGSISFSYASLLLFTIRMLYKRSH